MTAPGPVTVLKFGGSSFIELSDYAVVAKYVIGLLGSSRTRIVVVVSGMSGSSGRLLEAALSIDPGLQPQVQDQVLATAEMVSTGFLRAALHAAGCPATDLWAPHLGIRSDRTATRAKIVSIDPRPLHDALREYPVVVVAGGQAVDADNRITMLGRNSSDLTAVALAASLQAGRCDIFGDTPGIFTADPHVVPAARLLPQLTYRQCGAMSESGAKVLHWGAVRYAQEHGVIVRCRRLDAALTGEGPDGTTVGTGPGETAVVGDTRAGVYRLPPSCDVDAVVEALRDVNLLAHPIVQDGAAMLVFPAGQRPEQALTDLGVAAEPVDGYGMVSVVEPDGTATRWLVARDKVNATVVAEHERRYGASAAAGHAPVAAKARSPHSGLLLGSAAPAGSAGALTDVSRERPCGSS